VKHERIAFGLMVAFFVLAPLALSRCS